MAELLGFFADLPYRNRILRLKENGIALWDVCASGHRAGSLDSKILLSSCVPNDFDKFLGSHTKLAGICFNGSKAETLYQCKRFSLPVTLEAIWLPSTSPCLRRDAISAEAGAMARWSGPIHRFEATRSS